jgi:hypothetical protein
MSCVLLDFVVSFDASSSFLGCFSKRVLFEKFEMAYI